MRGNQRLGDAHGVGDGRARRGERPNQTSDHLRRGTGQPTRAQQWCRRPGRGRRSRRAAVPATAPARASPARQKLGRPPSAPRPPGRGTRAQPRVDAHPFGEQEELFAPARAARARSDSATAALPGGAVRHRRRPAGTKQVGAELAPSGELRRRENGRCAELSFVRRAAGRRAAADAISFSPGNSSAAARTRRPSCARMLAGSPLNMVTYLRSRPWTSSSVGGVDVARSTLEAGARLEREVGQRRRRGCHSPSGHRWRTTPPPGGASASS